MSLVHTMYVPDHARCPRRVRRQRGATLAEVVIAATLLTFVILGAIGSVSRSLSMTSNARMVTLSSQVL